MISGIYSLSFGTLLYIGRSMNIEQRYRSHISSLKAGKASRKLLEAYRDYGDPILSVLLECADLNTQKQEEVRLIKELNTFETGLNSTLGGEDVLYGELNNSSRYTNKQIYEVLSLLADSPNSSLQEVSDITGVALGTIKDISSCKKHIWLSIEYPDKYNKMKANAHIRKSRSLANLTSKYGFKSSLTEYPRLVSPEGEVVTIEGSLTAFAASKGLQLGNLSSVINGKRKSHKGWKVYKE